MSERQFLMWVQINILDEQGILIGGKGYEKFVTYRIGWKIEMIIL